MEFRGIRNPPRGIWNSVSPAGETESELFNHVAIIPLEFLRAPDVLFLIISLILCGIFFKTEKNIFEPKFLNEETN